MKKLLFTLTAISFSLVMGAQDLISKIPNNATAVVTIKGKRLTDLMSVDNFSTSGLGKLLGKNFSKKSDGKIESIEDLGIDLNNNFYYFLEVEEGAMTNCFLVPLENSEGFLNLLGASERERIVTEGGISYFQDDYDGTVTLWNDKTLMLIFAKDQTSDHSYNDLDYYEGFDEISPVPATETEITEEPAYTIEIEDVEVDVVEETVIEVPQGSTEIAESEIEATDDYNDYYNSEAYKKEQEEREKKRLEREAQRSERRKELGISNLKKAKAIMRGNYAASSILSNSSYVKSIGSGSEEASVWVNDFAKIYKQAMPSYLFGGASNPYDFMDIDKIYGGMSMAAKLDFEEGHAALKMIYSMNQEMANLYKPMYDGNFNKNFLKYLNEDRMLGYLSFNLSTEGVLTAYPELIDSMFKSGEKQTVADAVSIGTRLFSILIDEEAAAQIVRGDMLLVLTDLDEREVTYTDYEYDEDYNYTEVERTKTETVPDFLFMFTSEEKNLFDRLVRIGLNEKELEEINGMYHILSTGKAAPFDLYVMFKDGMVFLGSSLKDMTAIRRGIFVPKLSSAHKKSMRKNATSLFVNGKKIISEIPVDAYPKELQSKIQFLTDNTEDVQFNFEKIKGNVMNGEMIWKTPQQGHQNSFAYFINMIDALME